ncbi:hypothetical protein F5884DRAFT_102338 [Xylogone sp. PMI_703]|nr:hypothetical protein F5884DRAFT_102338 [Xylogone sp. PMI_703]
MHFNALFAFTSLVVLSANAQSTTTPTSEVLGASSTVTLTPAQSSQAACLAACPATNPICRASCVPVANGDTAQQNRTFECIAACSPGKGTASDNLAYTNCQKACLTGAAVTSPPAASPTATAGSSSGSSSQLSDSGDSSSAVSHSKGSGSNHGSGTATSSASGSSASSASSSSATPNAASGKMQLGSSCAGILGIFAAVLAL